MQSFVNNAQLQRHGEEANHHPYSCICGRTFGRLDPLIRHIRSKNKVLTHVCELCDEDDHPRAFARLDHLNQHLTHKHPEYQRGHLDPAGPAMGLQAQSPQPDIPDFPCLAPDCNRTGVLGYLRQVDLDEHLLLMHGLGPNYEPFAPINHEPLVPINYDPTVAIYSWMDSNVYQNQGNNMLLQNTVSPTTGGQAEAPEIDAGFQMQDMPAAGNEGVQLYNNYYFDFNYDI